jgi:hypothetical protein
MKTLISSTEDSATYEFTSGDATRVVEYNKPQPQVMPDSEEQEAVECEKPAPEQPFDHEAMSEAEYQGWLVWLGEDA